MSCQAQDVDNSDDDEWLDHIDFSKPVKVTMKDRRTDRELYIEMLKVYPLAKPKIYVKLF